ncbi:MAG: preprotein translocase subunit SecG [Burkholderiales bacterium]
MLETAVWLVHIVAAAGVIGLVLIQHGKGADMGAAFGSGSAGGLFGASGASNFLSRSTAILAAVFFSTSLLLTWYSGHGAGSSASVMQQALPQSPAVSTTVVPAAPDSKSSEIPK